MINYLLIAKAYIFFNETNKYQITYTLSFDILKIVKCYLNFGFNYVLLYFNSSMFQLK